MGVGIFTLLTASDTHKAIEQYREGDADHLMHAVSFYLNFVNIFVRIMEIVSRFTSVSERERVREIVRV